MTARHTDNSRATARTAGVRNAAPRAAAGKSAPRPAAAGSARPSPGARPRPAGAKAVPRSAPSRPARPKPQPVRQRRSGVRLLLLAAAALVAALLLRGRIFVLNEVKVEGNTAYADAQIAALSGLKLGGSIFEVNANAIARNFSADNHVKLIDVRVNYPDTVTLVVSERRPRAMVNCAGVILIVDEEGCILDRLSSLPESSDMIVVSGLDVSISAQGRQIESARRWQMDDMQTLLAALDERGLSPLISEMNLADRYNLYLVSRTGVQIVLGDEENIAGKLVWAQTVLEKLTQEGVMRGVLDVSTGKNAVYADR